MRACGRASAPFGTLCRNTPPCHTHCNFSASHFHPPPSHILASQTLSPHKQQEHSLSQQNWLLQQML
ncbi:hypothetical protein CLOM_g11146 [Closterium sp. NIES-68]|nr:hypothetical protein CLOM_g11146 [Closterium sp. NIES-68]